MVFAAAALGVIPCAAVMGEATEAIAARTGPGIGGLLNVTFGNAPELIIAFFALIEGLQEVVKASLVGSIIGNVLLVLGAAMLVGGWAREKQTFSRTAANAQSAMLMLALAALVFPALFQLIHGGSLPHVGADEVDFGSDLEHLSLGVALVLLVTYVRRPVLLAEDAPRRVQPVSGTSTRRRSTPGRCGGPRIYLALSAVAVGRDERDPRRARSPRRRRTSGCPSSSSACSWWRSSATPPSTGWRCSSRAKDKMDLAVNIAIGSSAQIALFVAPVLVLLSFVVGPHPMALVFNGYELGALLFAVLIANLVTQDGESNWFEGVQLLSLYAVLGLVFYFA